MRTIMILIALIGVIAPSAKIATARSFSPDACTFNVCEPSPCTGDPFDQRCAPCTEDEALIFADPDIDPKGAELGRMVCANLGDLLADGIRGAVAYCAQLGGMLIGYDDFNARPLCARVLTPNP